MKKQENLIPMRKIKLVSYIVLITFLFSQIAFADTIYFYHTDPAGTPIAMTDASGSVVWKADYKPFGEEWSITSNIENNKRFVGKEKDTETGLNYFGARYMLSSIGRFISTDPVGPVNPATGNINKAALLNPQKLNQYAYALNNPYKYLDPDGRYEKDVHYDLTSFLARMAGFDFGMASHIASANQGVDDNSETGSFAGEEARANYHFVTKQKLNQMFESACKEKDSYLFGQFLHAMQDSYSHAGFDADWGHWYKGTRPDKTYNNSEKADYMAEITYQYMRTFIEKLGVNNPDKWDEIKGQVYKFNRATNIKDKQKAVEY